MRELFDDVTISGQKDPDVGPWPQRPGQGGGNSGQSAHADKVVHLRRNKKDSQKAPLRMPVMLLCKNGSK